MKYKDLALQKIERLEGQMKNLEFALNRNNITEARKVMDEVKQRVEDLRSQISIEQDQDKRNQVV
jgi:hypothetical protein